MNMNDFQRLTLASMGEAKMIEHVRQGMRALEGHAEEAKDAANRMDNTLTAGAYMEHRDRLAAMMGFVLVDVAEVCEGLDMLMGDVAMENLEELLKCTRVVPAEMAKCESPTLGILRQIAEMAGKAVTNDE